MSADFRALVPLLIPIAVIQLGLMAFALVDLIKRKKVRGGNKWPWGVLVVIVGCVGPILYFVIGRQEE